MRKNCLFKPQYSADSEKVAQEIVFFQATVFCRFRKSFPGNCLFGRHSILRICPSCCTRPNLTERSGTESAVLLTPIGFCIYIYAKTLLLLFFYTSLIISTRVMQIKISHVDTDFGDWWLAVLKLAGGVELNMRGRKYEELTWAQYCRSGVLS